MGVEQTITSGSGLSGASMQPGVVTRIDKMSNEQVYVAANTVIVQLARLDGSELYNNFRDGKFILPKTAIEKTAIETINAEEIRQLSDRIRNMPEWAGADRTEKPDSQKIEVLALQMNIMADAIDHLTKFRVLDDLLIKKRQGSVGPDNYIRESFDGPFQNFVKQLNRYYQDHKSSIVPKEIREQF